MQKNPRQARQRFAKERQARLEVTCLQKGSKLSWIFVVEQDNKKVLS